MEGYTISVRADVVLHVVENGFYIGIPDGFYALPAGGEPHFLAGSVDVAQEQSTVPVRTVPVAVVVKVVIRIVPWRLAIERIGRDHHNIKVQLLAVLIQCGTQGISLSLAQQTGIVYQPGRVGVCRADRQNADRQQQQQADTENDCRQYPRTAPPGDAYCLAHTHHPLTPADG